MLRYDKKKGGPRGSFSPFKNKKIKRNGERCGKLDNLRMSRKDRRCFQTPTFDVGFTITHVI